MHTPLVQRGTCYLISLQKCRPSHSYANATHVAELARFCITCRMKVARLWLNGVRVSNKVLRHRHKFQSDRLSRQPCDQYSCQRHSQKHTGSAVALISCYTYSTLLQVSRLNFAHSHREDNTAQYQITTRNTDVPCTDISNKQVNTCVYCFQAPTSANAR